MAEFFRRSRCPIDTPAVLVHKDRGFAGANSCRNIFKDDAFVVLSSRLLRPNYNIDTIVGAKEVIANGGEVKIIPIKQGYSTTGIINRMKS